MKSEKKLDLIFGLADASKVLQVIVHYEQFVKVNQASGITGERLGWKRSTLIPLLRFFQFHPSFSSLTILA